MGTVFIDFQKAFDCVSHPNLLHKLEHNFGITGNLLAWLRDYLSEREQYTVINGVPSENRPFLSSCLPPLQSEYKCEVFLMKISFNS